MLRSGLELEGVTEIRQNPRCLSQTEMELGSVGQSWVIEALTGLTGYPSITPPLPKPQPKLK